MAAFAEAQAKLEAGEAELEAGRETLEQNQAEYEKGLAQWQQGSEQLGQLQQLADGEEAYRAGVQQMVDQLTEAGLSITYEEADALIRELAALDEFPSTAQELLQYILAWLQQGDVATGRSAVGDALANFRTAAASYAETAASVPMPATPESAAPETQTEQTALPDLAVLDTLQSALQQATPEMPPRMVKPMRCGSRSWKNCAVWPTSCRLNCRMRTTT